MDSSCKGQVWHMRVGSLLNEGKMEAEWYLLSSLPSPHFYQLNCSWWFLPWPVTQWSSQEIFTDYKPSRYIYQIIMTFRYIDALRFESFSLLSLTVQYTYSLMVSVKFSYSLFLSASVWRRHRTEVQPSPVPSGEFIPQSHIMTASDPGSCSQLYIYSLKLMWVTFSYLHLLLLRHKAAL